MGLSNYQIMAMISIQEIHDGSDKEKLKEFKYQAVQTVLQMVTRYSQEGIIESILIKVMEKKLEFIKAASSKTHLDQILKASVPYYNGAEFLPKTQYHIEEEELILWSETSLRGPLIHAAFQRYIGLFQKLIGDII